MTIRLIVGYQGAIALDLRGETLLKAELPGEISAQSLNKAFGLSNPDFSKKWNYEVGSKNVGKDAELYEKSKWLFSNGLTLSERNFFNINLEEARVYGADFRYSQLEWALLKRAQLQRSRFNEADLTNANLYGAELEEADLSKAKLRRTNLNNANMKGANLTEVRFQGADIFGTDFSGSYGINSAIFEGARFNTTELVYKNQKMFDFGEDVKESVGERKVIPPTVFPEGFNPLAYGMIQVGALADDDACYDVINHRLISPTEEWINRSFDDADFDSPVIQSISWSEGSLEEMNNEGFRKIMELWKKLGNFNPPGV